MSWVVYVPETRELRTITEALVAGGRGMTSISWKVRVGRRIGPNDHLADVHWASGPLSQLLAPDGCSGIIGAINRQLNTMTVANGASRLLLRLKQ